MSIITSWPRVSLPIFHQTALQDFTIYICIYTYIYIQ